MSDKAPQQMSDEELLNTLIVEGSVFITATGSERFEIVKDLKTEVLRRMKESGSLAKERDEALAEIERLQSATAAAGLSELEIDVLRQQWDVQRLLAESSDAQRRFKEQCQRGDDLAQQLITAHNEIRRLKAAAPGRTEQATDEDGDLWWQHACGSACEWRDGTKPTDCTYCALAGPWHPLLVAAEPQTSEPAEEVRNGGLTEVRAPQDSSGEPANADPAAPLVLRLPEVPEGAVALTFRQDPAKPIRFTLTEGPLAWRMVDDAGEVHYWALIDLLAHYGPVEVEMAPPREPRTWPKLDDAPDYEDAPRVVDVAGEGRWVLEGVRYVYPGASPRSLHELRELGDVTEVFK